MRVMFCLILWLVWGGGAQAAEALVVERVLSGDSIQLTDGRVVRLLAVKAPDEAALAESSRQALQDWLGQREATMTQAGTDRYGRVTATVRDQGDTQETAQAAMVRTGQVFVFPPLGAAEEMAALLKLESAARAARRGLWADALYADLAPDGAKIAAGRFVFVQGKIRDAARVKNKIYLNFGADWRTDFTAQIASTDLRLFKKAGLDPLTLKGRTVRVRGTAQPMFGPMIALTQPAQLEILE